MSRFADAVVALDDGSTDATGEILGVHPLVRVLLSSPRRESYADWDDAVNRNRLLAAAARLAPSFVVSLDADERIDVDDAVALRSLVEGVSADGRAYLFSWWRMVEDVSQCSPPPLWIGRLFSYEPGRRSRISVFTSCRFRHRSRRVVG